MADHYLPDEAYDRLVAELIDPESTFDTRRGQVTELLGELGGIWPESYRADAESDEAA